MNKGLIHQFLEVHFKVFVSALFIHDVVLNLNLSKLCPLNCNVHDLAFFTMVKSYDFPDPT